MKQGIIAFIKKESVLTFASFLAILSCFLIPPDRQYVDYIDLRTLILLFCLMAVTAGLREIGFFRWTAGKFLNRIHTERGLTIFLIGLCFCGSMLITNDVALITFVPFTILILNMAHCQSRALLIVIFETIAANLGSMLTPIGNPQNLYLYTVSQSSATVFFQTMLPYTVISGILLLLEILWMVRKKESIPSLVVENIALDKKRLVFYSLLFFLCLLAIVRILRVEILLAIVVVNFLLIDPKILKDVDYRLLLTFIAFFVLVGNLGRLPFFRDVLTNVLVGHEILAAVGAS